MSACKGCGATVVQPPSRGRPRLWCSERCRKRTLYSGTCEDCGGRTSGREGGFDRVPTRCLKCERTRNEERNARIVELWNGGVNVEQVAATVGIRVDQARGVIQHGQQRGEDVALHRLGGGAEEREARRQQMLKLRREGKSNAEIADLLGFSGGDSVSQAFVRMRRKGIEVPAYRRAA